MARASMATANASSFEGDHRTGKRKSETSEIESPTKKNKLGTSEKATHPYNLRSLSKKNNPAPAIPAYAKATAATAKQRGVRQRKSGKWTAEIGNPFETGKKIYLGSFASFEEAANAYNDQKLRFSMMLGLRRRQRARANTIVSGQTETG